MAQQYVITSTHELDFETVHMWEILRGLHKHHWKQWEVNNSSRSVVHEQFCNHANILAAWGLWVPSVFPCQVTSSSPSISQHMNWRGSRTWTAWLKRQSGSAAMWKHLNRGKYVPLFRYTVPLTAQRLIDLSVGRQISFVARNESHRGEIKHFKVFNNGAVG